MATQLTASYIANATVVFIFMTDGEGNFPVNEIQSHEKFADNLPKQISLLRY